MNLNWISKKEKVTDAEIDTLEKDLNVCLPKDYKEYIKDVNGAALKKVYYSDGRLGRIPYSRNINLLKSAKFGIYNIFHDFDKGTGRYFPFGSVGNGDYFCFDLKTNSVVLYEHETEAFHSICETFSQFIGSLKEEA
ncbi:hypothetical protein BXO88_04055 [Oribacterium sp. C9]|uniref:SMI1/KNR4 family protein n=1 Tax=Oribacterium sp. C9 TaxID=1943579 RepID=UPI00098ECE64|nr:SMI1/KNR4 family protein [Oribacterium sp. C9]OON87453.1 hypothetical protein BXO88_04055 [Oribacterium sp. C9]